MIINRLKSAISRNIIFYPYTLIEKNSINFVKSVIEMCGLDKKDIVLDIGSGDCVYRQYIKSKYIALDYPSDTEERSAQSKKPDIFAEGCQLPFKDMSISLAMATCVIEHVRSPQLLVKEVSRILRPEGYFLLTAPQCFRIHEAPYDYWRFTKYGLKELFTQYGFEVIRLEPSNNSSFITAWMVLLEHSIRISTVSTLPSIILASFLSFTMWLLYPLFIWRKDSHNKEHPADWFVLLKKKS